MAANTAEIKKTTEKAKAAKAKKSGAATNPSAAKKPPSAKKKVLKEGQSQLSTSDIQNMLIKLDFEKSNTVKNAFHRELSFREATKKELHNLISQIKELCSKQDHTDLEKFHKQLLEKFDIDLKLVEALNKELKTRNDVSIPVRDNKLAIKHGVIEGAKKFVEKHFYDICAGKLDEDYNFDSNIVSVLGNTKGAKGNSKETYLKAVLIPIYLHFSKQSIPQMQGGKWIDETPIASVHALPKDIDLSKVGVETQGGKFTSFEECSYFFKDERTPKGLFVPHSGYEFGAGHGKDPRNPNGKRLSSLDCSSGVSNCLGYKQAVSTLDQFYYYQLKTKKLEATAPWVNTNQCQMMQDSSAVTNPADVKPGDIYSYRKYNLTNNPQMNGDGTGGHTAIVVQEVRPDGKFWTIGWNRDMPRLEGVGLQEFNCKIPGIKPSFFRQNKQ